MSTNLYVQIGPCLVRGRIIQSVYFYHDKPEVCVTYLNGRKQYITTDEQCSIEDMERILAEINAIHAEPCYPSDSDGSGCPLGMANI